MADFFTSSAVTVEKLLSDSGAGLEVPVLQRKYVWEEPDITKLLGDIKESYESEDEQHYFLGGMVFAENGEAQRLIVFDGQQRLSTIHLVLAVARDIFAARNEKAEQEFYSQLVSKKDLNADGKPVWVYRLKLYSSDDAMLRVLLSDSSDLKLNAQTVSQRKLVEAKAVIREFLEEIRDLSKFMMYVYKNVYVVRTVAKDQNTAFRIFETLNNRGKMLRPDDLLKNLICSYLDDSDYEKFGNQWDAFIGRLNDNERVLVDISTFLKHYIMSLGEYVNKERIYEWFRKNQEPRSAAEAFALLQNLDNAALQYRKFVKAEGGDHLRALRTLSFRQGYVLLLATSAFSVATTAKIGALIEDIAFCYAITGKKTNVLEHQFCDLSRQAREGGEKSEATVIDSMIKIRNELKVDVEQAIRKIVYPAMTGKRKVKYLLNRLAKALDGGNYTKHEIEHILPENTPLTPEQSQRQLMAIGNLTLLTREENASAKDKPLSEKQSIYRATSCRLTKMIVEPVVTGTKNTAHDKALRQMNYSPLSTPYLWTADEIVRRADAIARLARYDIFGEEAK